MNQYDVRDLVLNRTRNIATLDFVNHMETKNYFFMFARIECAYMMDWIVSALILLCLFYFGRVYASGILLIRKGEFDKGKLILKRTFLKLLLFIVILTFVLSLYFMILKG